MEASGAERTRAPARNEAVGLCPTIHFGGGFVGQTGLLPNESPGLIARNREVSCRSQSGGRGSLGKFSDSLGKTDSLGKAKPLVQWANLAERVTQLEAGLPRRTNRSWPSEGSPHPMKMRADTQTPP